MTTATATKSMNTAKNGSPAEDDLAREVEGLRKDLASLTERFSSLTDAGIRTANDFTHKKSAEARERGEAIYSELSDRAGEIEQQAMASVRRHPLQALGIAAGVGFLAAMLTRR